MADFSSLQQKVDALKAKVEQSSITPPYLGSILDDFITQMKSIDMTDMSADLQTAITNATLALQKANQALTASHNADITAKAANSAAASARDIADATKAVTDTKGLPGGLASLDSGGKVPASQLPGYVDDVIEFNAMVSDVTSQMTSVAHKSTDTGCMVVYDTDNDVFLLAVSSVAVIDSVNGSASINPDKITYYNNWLDGDSFGDETLNGRVPVEGKLYPCTSDNKLFYWNGSQLAMIGSDLALGRSDSTAFPGDAGAALEETASDHNKRIAENTLLRDTLLPLDALVDVPESSSLFSDRVGMSVDQVVWNTATQRLWGWNSATNHYYSSWPTWQKYGTQAKTGAKGVIPAANRILYMASNPQTLYVKSNTAGLEQLHEATVNRTLANYNHLLAVDKKIGRLEENEADDERRITAVEEVAEMGRTKANAVQEATKGARFININTFTETDDAFPSLSDALDCVPEDYRWIYGTIVTFLYQGPWIVNGKQKQVRKWLWYRWTATAGDEDADWMHTDEWEQLPEMSHVTELGNRVTAAEERLDTSGPLPFVFERHNRHFKDTDVAVYSRDERRFYRLGEVIAPEELGYNEEDPETGEVTASTRRRFICGNRLYRFTGIDFVDVAVERSTERRLVRKTPSINSHPGLVYINKNIIRLPQPGPSVGDVVRIRLDGMYWRPSASLVPLSELEVRYTTGCLSVERDGGSLVVTRTRDCRSYGDAARSRLYLILGEDISQDPYRHSGIGVRYDGSGRKVFYSCSQTVFPNAGWMPGEEGLRHVWKNCVDVNASHISIRCQRCPHVQVQLWTKTKSRNKGVNKCRWRWRGGSDTFRKVWRDHCLVRVRLRHGGRNGVWSEWGYVHVMRVRNDSGGYGFNVRWSRQERK